VYYSAQIVFFGAEFTQVYANRFGKRIVPSANADPVTEEQRVQQGMPSPTEIPKAVEQYFDGWRSRSTAAIAETLTHDAAYFDPRVPDGERGPALLARIESFLRACPDVAFKVLSTTRIGDGQVAALYEMSGTDAWTGKALKVSGCDLFMLDGDRIQSIYSYFNPDALEGTSLSDETIRRASAVQVAHS
jgi:hypothetical protein